MKSTARNDMVTSVQSAEGVCHRERLVDSRVTRWVSPMANKSPVQVE